MTTMDPMMSSIDDSEDEVYRRHVRASGHPLLDPAPPRPEMDSAFAGMTSCVNFVSYGSAARSKN